MLSADGKATLRHVQLTPPMIQILGMVCDRGGEIEWDWESSALMPAAAAVVGEMINREILIEREYVQHAMQARGKLYLRATELGRAVYEQLEKARADHARAPASVSAPSGMSSPAEETNAKEQDQ